MSAKQDNELVTEVLNGNISSFEEIINRYQKPLFNLVLKMVNNYDDAKDITQDVFIKVYEKLDNFNFKHRFFSWIYRIAINESINFLKTRKPAEKLQTWHLSMTETTDDPDKEQMTKNLREAIKKMNPDQRALMLLKYCYQFSYEEIGEVLRIPSKTVKSRLFSARNKLHELLTN